MNFKKEKNYQIGKGPTSAYVGAMVVERPDNDEYEMCSKYLKFAKTGRVYQQIKTPRRNNLDEYFFNKPLGKTILGGFMKIISEMAGLSKTYTNHCIRATFVTDSLRAGYEASSVTKITGHKSIQSLQPYAGALHKEEALDICKSLGPEVHSRKQILGKAKNVIAKIPENIGAVEFTASQTNSQVDRSINVSNGATLNINYGATITHNYYN